MWNVFPFSCLFLGVNVLWIDGEHLDQVIEDQHNVPRLDPVLRPNPQRQTPRNEKGNHSF